MVVDGIAISFLKASDSLVLCQRVGEALLEIVLGEVLLGQDLAELH
jgi:hypothetical protein